MVYGLGLVFFAIIPLHPVMAVLEISVPAELYLSKVPQKAKEVLSDPVLFLIASTNVLVPLHEHGLSPALGGSVALTNSKSPDVHEVFGGGTCANDFVEINKKKIKQKMLKERNK